MNGPRCRPRRSFIRADPAWPLNAAAAAACRSHRARAHIAHKATQIESALTMTFHNHRSDQHYVETHRFHQQPPYSHIYLTPNERQIQTPQNYFLNKIS